MKTAIILTGAMRSFDKCLPSLQNVVFRHYQDAKYYIATANDEDATKAGLLGSRIANIAVLDQPEMVIPDGCPNEWTPGHPYMHEPYAISVHPHAVLGQLWMLRQGWELYRKSGELADLIIRCRPDLFFQSFHKPQGDVWHSQAITPWWGRFGGVNDRFALLGPNAAHHYFTTYDKVQRFISDGRPLHPETVVAASLRDGDCSIDDTLKAEFCTLRKNGEMRPPEITTIDLAHFSQSG